MVGTPGSGKTFSIIAVSYTHLTDTVGVQHPAEMGRCLGEVADTLSDGAFLRGDALLRGLLCAAAL